MKFTTPLLALSATTALAAPVTHTTRDELAITGAYLCNDRDWTGYCVHIFSPQGECVPLAGDLNDLVSSAGPDQGSFCYFFVDPACNIAADFFHVSYPGFADLSVVPVNGPVGSTRNFEDKLSSYFCVTEKVGGE
ncbi:hypothetical protein CC86DRAFT_99600 [Ophiobolus disseminans]|uniref:Uncharacterized protein n=1 Tax=Ophiobolus disseminans TaxID=1469910 RepID=A0A6A6ZL79_9PLEO|nr:hypothetical protein CC86DRAFT_99600 [Ophiobolus disseminans]